MTVPFMENSQRLAARSSGLLDVSGKELLDEFVSCGVAELRPAVPSALDNMK